MGRVCRKTCVCARTAHVCRFVDPKNAQTIALDVQLDAPIVTLARPSDGGAARLLTAPGARQRP
jgi:hypothetical protein